MPNIVKPQPQKPNQNHEETTNCSQKLNKMSKKRKMESILTKIMSTKLQGKFLGHVSKLQPFIDYK